ncbi:unnamed protein product [Pedinophyceae sp. YPF-701]|nr:unnamed protein product [Pedinophyceae sp. YPF-701]
MSREHCYCRGTVCALESRSHRTRFFGAQDNLRTHLKKRTLDLPVGFAPCAPTALRASPMALSRFSVTGPAGKGQHSSVVIARDDVSGTTVALKVVNTDSLDHLELVQLRREALIQGALSHPSVLALYGALKEDNYYVMVLERAHSDAQSFIKPPAAAVASPAETSRIMTTVAVPLAEALAYLRSLGVLHRDIKPENLVFDGDGRLKLCDFGFAMAPVGEQRPVTRLGTVEFIAPEVAGSGAHCTGNTLPRELREGYDAACDVWSYGVTLFELLHGRTPFGGCGSNGAVLDMIRTSGETIAERAISPALPEGVRGLLQACLRQAPAERPSAAELPALAAAAAARNIPRASWRTHSAVVVDKPPRVRGKTPTRPLRFEIDNSVFQVVDAPSKTSRVRAQSAMHVSVEPQPSMPVAPVSPAHGPPAGKKRTRGGFLAALSACFGRRASVASEGEDARSWGGRPILGVETLNSMCGDTISVSAATLQNQISRRGVRSQVVSNHGQHARRATAQSSTGIATAAELREGGSARGNRANVTRHRLARAHVTSSGAYAASRVSRRQVHPQRGAARTMGGTAVEPSQVVTEDISEALHHRRKPAPTGGVSFEWKGSGALMS